VDFIARMLALSDGWREGRACAPQPAVALAMAGHEQGVPQSNTVTIPRERARTVRKTIDWLIATFCLIHGHSLLHHDRDFDPFEDPLDLQVVHP
jgi:hypothetical protein